MDGFNEGVSRVGRSRGGNEAASNAGLDHLQFTKQAGCIAAGHNRGSEEAARLIGAVAADEGSAFSLGKFSSNFARDPRFDVEERIIKHALGRRNVGVNFTNRRSDFAQFRCGRRRTRSGFTHPARSGAAHVHQLLVVRGRNGHDVGDGTERADLLDQVEDRAIQLFRHGHAAFVGGHSVQACALALHFVFVAIALARPVKECGLVFRLRFGSGVHNLARKQFTLGRLHFFLHFRNGRVDAVNFFLADNVSGCALDFSGDDGIVLALELFKGASDAFELFVDVSHFKFL